MRARMHQQKSAQLAVCAHHPLCFLTRVVLFPLCWWQASAPRARCTSSSPTSPSRTMSLTRVRAEGLGEWVGQGAQAVGLGLV